MKFLANKTAIAAFSAIILAAPFHISAAHAQARFGGVRSTNGAAGCLGNTTQGGCRANYNDGTGNTFKGQSNYSNTSTNFSNRRNTSWTRNNGNNGSGTVSNDYDKTTKTGVRNANRSGTYNGTDYTYDKTTNYSEGQVCRTVNGTYGTYTYTNSGKLSCQ
ncbi:hypothetical protein [Pseudanabaena sp. PCC 6802]|uniref:hypothetical protein n=1 Tax=Pseudanabaena sp. PCC 6802 TaxID=118173 RepID=UPI0003484290|nr:hypothetical protein [Pseudanabaena sp. PCC 6802]